MKRNREEERIVKKLINKFNLTVPDIKLLRTIELKFYADEMKVSLEKLSEAIVVCYFDEDEI